ncbi:homoserine kinase [Woodsholea maritima]|uniref:homoserine kinase n=1 Tax=Woodsholea maritima TaxID=240237 RepID=UPI000375B13D|nr:homoserine kinase [Woodsholea maritima]
MARIAIAKAPASLGNIGVGYDVLGQAFAACFDTVTATRLTETTGTPVELGAVSGRVSILPKAREKNTALAAAGALLDHVGAKFSVRLDIDKGVPMSAGMGGSAASAVAGVAATNALLDEPLPLEALLPFALIGEAVSANPPPWDNVMASLHGGIVMAAQLEPAIVKPLPTPSGISCILFHPDHKIETQAARALLAPKRPHKIVVEHARRIAAFTAGLALNDLELIEAGLEDIFVEPQRAPLLPGFNAIKAAALDAGALGASFSGAGPSMFAWCLEDQKDAVAAAMAEAFAQNGLDATRYDAPINSPGVSVEIKD